MKFVALVSGGKDSIYSIIEALRQGHEIVGCVHLSRPKSSERQATKCDAITNDADHDVHVSEGEGEEEEEESYMYQTSGSEAVRVMVEECLGLPLVEYTRTGRSVNTSLVYRQGAANDEVEDLYRALVQAKQQWGDDSFEAVSSGAILSTYQRVRVENVCGRLGLKSLGYLWRKASQKQLLDEMIKDGIEAVLVRVAAPPGLQPRRHLNRTIRELQPHFDALWHKYQFHVCGEGGEYETLVLDSPIFRRRLVLDQVHIIENSDDGVGELRVLSCHSEEKDLGVDASLAVRMVPASASGVAPNSSLAPPSDREDASSMVVDDHPSSVADEAVSFVRVHQVGGRIVCIGDVRATNCREPLDASLSEADLAVQEAVEIFQTLRLVLHNHGCSTEDVVMVHLYLSDISHFATINLHYRDFFGVVLPPSRVCVGLGSMGEGRRVQLDCWAMRGSGASMRNLLAPSPKQLRSVLHVQSLSHWAPVCVGPYSQVNTVVTCGCHFVAGQIGLDPPTMQLRNGWKEQLRQSWTNTANILDALDVTFDNVLMGMVYVTQSTCLALNDDVLDSIREVCDCSRSTNGGIIPGGIDRVPKPHTSRDEFDGYEDEETRNELSRNDHVHNAHEGVAPVPLLVVVVSDLPVGAEVEVEVVASSMEAFATLPSNQSFSLTQLSAESSSSSDELPYELGVHVQSLGSGSISFGIVTAFLGKDRPCGVNCQQLLTRMLQRLSEECMASPVHIPPIQHLRLYYDASAPNNAVESAVDYSLIRTTFHDALLSVLGDANPPAISMIPTKGMGVLWSKGSSKPKNRTNLSFAIQAIMIDSGRAETDLWIHHRR
jgi:diphthine-ammonia ligase